MRFALEFTSRGDLPAALAEVLGWNVPEVEILEGDCKSACAAIETRASTERLPVKKRPGGQTIVAHQQVIAVATLETAVDRDDKTFVREALDVARSRWGSRLTLAAVRHGNRQSQLLCLLVPSNPGMRARAEFDPNFRAARTKRARPTERVGDVRRESETSISTRRTIIVNVSENGVERVLAELAVPSCDAVLPMQQRDLRCRPNSYSTVDQPFSTAPCAPPEPKQAKRQADGYALENAAGLPRHPVLVPRVLTPAHVPRFGAAASITSWFAKTMKPACYTGVTTEACGLRHGRTTSGDSTRTLLFNAKQRRRLPCVSTACTQIRIAGRELTDDFERFRAFISDEGAESLLQHQFGFRKHPKILLTSREDEDFGGICVHQGSKPSASIRRNCWYRVHTNKPNTNMPLTELAIRFAKAEARLTKLSDGGGLQLCVTPDGARRWRLAYRFGGGQKVLALGVYPNVGLKDARAARYEAKRVFAKGLDPTQAKKQAKVEKASRSSREDVWYCSVVSSFR